MADIKDLIKEIKKEAQNTRWKSPHSIKSIKQTLVSANKETAADKEKAAEAKLSADAQLTQLTNISDTLYKMYNDKQSASNDSGSKSSGLLSALGLGALAKAAGTGILAGAAGVAAMGVAISAFFGGLVAGDKLLNVATDWMNTDFNFSNIKKAAAGFSGIINEMNAKDFAVLGGIMGASAIGGVKAALGVGSMGAAISSFFVGLLAGNQIIAGMDFLGADLNYGAIKKAAAGFTDIIGAMDTKALVSLGLIMTGGAFAGIAAKKPTDAAVGMASLSAGIAGFFGGLLVGDKALAWIGTDFTALPAVMKNFSESIGGLSTEAQVSLAAMLGAGGVIGVLGKGTDVAKGMTALGAGIAGFFTGIGVGDKLTAMMGVDGSKLSLMMSNLAEGIGSFSGNALVALGSLLGAGALFGATGIAGPAAIGMGAIGVGIGAFMTGIGAGEGLLKLMGTDGGTLKTFLTNMSSGLSKLADIDGKALAESASSLYKVGPAIAAFAASEGLGKLGSLVGDAWDSITSFFGTEKSESTSPMAGLIEGMVHALKPLEGLNTDTLSKFDEVGDAMYLISEGAREIADLDKRAFNENLLFIASSLIGAAEKYGRVSDLYSGLTLDVVPRISGNVSSAEQLQEMLTAQGVAEVQLNTSPNSSINGQASNTINDPTIRANQRAQATQPIVVNAPSNGGNTAMSTNSNVTYINNKVEEDQTLFSFM